jgi:PAS domain S-box-containing protein
MSSNKLVASLRQELAEAQARIRYLEECDTMDDRSRSLRVFADHVEQVFWMADPAIRSMLYVSPSYERVWGRRCADLYLNPKSFLDSVHPEDLPNVLTVLRQQELGESFDHSYRIITPSGEVRWIRDRGRPVRNESAAIWCHIGIAEDVTDRRLADERVRFQARVLECVQESVIVTDTHGTVIYWNQGAEALYGWPTAEATGRPIYELTVPEELISQQRAEEIMAALARGDKWSGEFTVRRLDGTSFVAGVTNHPLLRESGEVIGIIGVSVDITEHKRSEEFRAQNESLLEQRVADRTQEISNVRTRLELASDATRLGIWEWDLSTGRATWNDRMFSIYGLSPSDFDGSVDSVMRNIHPEDKASLVTTLRTLADSGVAEKVTYRVLRGDALL